MESLCVFTANFTHQPERHGAILRASCRRAGIALEEYGHGMDFPGMLRAKVVLAREFLLTRTEEYALFTDSWDSYVLEPAEEILKRYHALAGNAGVLLAAEKNCFPDAIEDQYPASPTPWRFVNAGGWMGRRDILIGELEQVAACAGEDDQRAWTRRYLDTGPPRLALDVGCHVFQTMWGAGVPATELTSDGLNRVTGTRPAVWHFNGSYPDIAEWYAGMST